MLRLVNSPRSNARPAMKLKNKILICGGGIAGPACAHWLQKYGYSIVIVEKASGLRDGGQNVDIKGAGQYVLHKMGLAEDVEAKNTRERGVKFQDTSGRVFATFPRGAFAGLTEDVEILRGDLAHILHSSVKDVCEYRFGTYVTALLDTAEGMVASFNTGEEEVFDVVIAADGLGSSTRAMVLAEETSFRYLGAHMAFFDIPRRSGDDGWAMSSLGGGMAVFLRPGKSGHTTVLTTFLAEETLHRGTPAEQRSALAEALTGRGALADRVRSELASVSDFYFGPMSQVNVARWWKGRAVLLGDAGYCPTPFTGKGTALALVGAYLLAGEIKRSATLIQAFANYEQLLRPYVEASQNQLSARSIRMMHPSSPGGAWITRQALKVLASRPVQFLFRPTPDKRKKAIAEDFVFPDYT
jgi:2-polyprenyl-6-methoxyphenol hydroxylase-like FAD-dependent oxidoreductase